MSEENYYSILGVEKTATAEEIKEAYRKLVKIHHPDCGGNKDAFLKIQQAYEALENEDTRKKYDDTNESPAVDNTDVAIIHTFIDRVLEKIEEQEFSRDFNPYISVERDIIEMLKQTRIQEIPLREQKFKYERMRDKTVSKYKYVQNALNEKIEKLDKQIKDKKEIYDELYKLLELCKKHGFLQDEKIYQI